MLADRTKKGAMARPYDVATDNRVKSPTSGFSQNLALSLGKSSGAYPAVAAVAHQADRGDIGERHERHPQGAPAPAASATSISLRGRTPADAVIVLSDH